MANNVRLQKYKLEMVHVIRVDVKHADIMQESSYFQGRNKTYKILRGGTCNTTNVTYLFSCYVCCGPVYVGETGRTMRERLREHLWDIRACRDRVVANHFNSKGHSSQDAEFFIEAVQKQNTTYRRIRRVLD